MSQDEDLPPLAERRPHLRRKVLFGATVVGSTRHNGVACQVRDISDTGARVAVRSSAILPEILYLVIHRDQQAYRAKVAWRNGSQAGLTFVDAIDLTSALPLSLSFLKRAAQSGDYLSWR